MNERTLRILEFDAVRRRIAGCALSEEAARRILAETPYTDAAAVRAVKSLVSEAVGRFESGGAEPRGSLPDICFLFAKLAVEGACLDLDEACAAGLFVERGIVFKNWLASCQTAFDKTRNPPSGLAALAADIPDCSVVAREIFRVVNKDGSLKDLPEFQAITRAIRRISGELDAAIARYASDSESRRMLQSAVPSQRDGRTVLAVKANYRGRIRGIVHEVSATGQTLFIEPEDVVEKNNDLLIEKRRLDAEILRVLRELTAHIAEHRELLADFHEKIIAAETLRAKAQYSRETGGVFAKDGSGFIDKTTRRFVLKQARHPLLGKAAVPIDFEMGADTRTVIITGPNTGGKTVSLKTAGLFALMNQIGVAVPAAEGTSLPLFDGVFADIGDEQSISQSLSTFSAHMTNIAAIARAATSHSLVLLDELGSGTDPEEGGAIAMAILDFFIEKKAFLIITSHHGVLKNYGYTREQVENASVEFDGRTLSPTYRIVMGVPGESRAIDIAARNGLGETIIAGARSYIGEHRSDVSALITGLKQKRLELESAEEDRRAEERRLLEERRKADLKELRLRQKELEIKAGEVGRLKRMLSESRKTLENLVREVKEGEITREKTLKVKEFLNDFAISVTREADLLENERIDLKKTQKEREAEENTACGMETDETDAQKTLLEGAEVRVLSYKQRGTLVRREKSGAWLVEIGSIRAVFPAEDLVPVHASPPRPAPVLTDLSRDSAAVLELNLLGMRLEEALDALRRQLDAAVLAGLPSFAVVHGKGGGILQHGVHDFLQHDPRIVGFAFSRPELGGFGRTEVTISE